MRDLTTLFGTRIEQGHWTSSSVQPVDERLELGIDCPLALAWEEFEAARQRFLSRVGQRKPVRTEGPR